MRIIILIFFLLVNVGVHAQSINGTVSGGTFSPDVPPALAGNGLSVSFDGVDDKVVTATDFTLNPSASSISLWFKTNDLDHFVLASHSSNGSYLVQYEAGYFYMAPAAGGSAYCPVTITTGVWYNLIITRSNGVTNFYLNGTGLTMTSQGATGSLDFIMNTFGLYPMNSSGGYELNGKIADVRVYSGVLSSADITSINNGTDPSGSQVTLQHHWKMNDGSGTRILDYQSPADAFITASGITDAAQKNAINQLVTDLKSAGVWNKMKAIYPFAGGTATIHKWNLKDPRDLDAAYRLTFSGGIVHSAEGAKWDGSTGYANTHCEFTSANSMNMTYYSRENSTTNDYPMGVYINSQATQFSLYFYYDNPTWNVQARTNTYDGTGYTTASGITDTKGLWTITRTASNANAIYQNGVSKATSAAGPNSMDAGFPVFIGARNLGGQPTGPSTRQCAFASMGDFGVTSTEAAALNQAVNTYLANLTSNPPPPPPPPGSQWITAGNNIYNANSGSVGIGTDKINASGYKLFVEGTIRARKLKVDTETWPDFVFDKKYKLLSLAEIEKFIKLNQHLPGIPSAKEVEKNGVDIGDNQGLLLKKIEELTLLLIEQNKKMERQNKKIEDQNKKINQLEKAVNKKNR